MLELRIFLPFYLTTQARCWRRRATPTGRGSATRSRSQLAAETGMRFYDAETMRRVAHLAPDRDAVVAQLRTALELARSQAARPFELRIALDLHDLLGAEARPLLERAIAAFDARDATSELDEARARVLIPR